MPVPSGVLWDVDPHTLAKHRLLENYLAAWLPTLLQGGFRGVTYAEGFAGPGIYTGGRARLPGHRPADVPWPAGAPGQRAFS